MAPCPPISRRLLLGRLGSGTGIVGTFLLPGAALAAAAASGRSAPAAPARQGARPPPPLVMLDPGHGGKDPGAIGFSGTYEKQVSLAAAFELKRQLEAQGRYRVALTRTRDAFIPLDERVAKAQAHGAALFVSMHADALSDHTVRGASVYTLADTASDAQTAALAQRENSADRAAAPASTPRPRSPASWRAWCGGRRESAPAGWPAAWSAVSTATCRCCRIRSGMPDSSC